MAKTTYTTQPEYKGELTHVELRALPRYVRHGLRLIKGKKRVRGPIVIAKSNNEHAHPLCDALGLAAQRGGRVPHGHLIQSVRYRPGHCARKGYHSYIRTSTGRSRACMFCKRVMTGLDPATAPKPFKGRNA